MIEQRSLADQLALYVCRLAFYFPLLVCTYLALVPEPPDNPVFRLGDVILHAAAFAYLTFAFVLMMPTTIDRTIGLDCKLAIRATLVMFGYGVFLELVQSLIPERTAELKDLGVDLLGIGGGLLLAVLLAGSIARLLRAVGRILTGGR